VDPIDPEPDGPPPPPFVRERAARRRRRWTWAVAAVSALVLVGATFGAVMGWTSLEFEVAQEEPPDVGDEPGEGAAPDGEEADPEPSEEPADAEEPEDGPEEAEDRPTEEPEVSLEFDDDGRPDREVPADERLDPPDLSGLDEAQRVIADMLLDIDASERAMLGFQLDARSAFEEAGDPDELDARLRSAATLGLEALALLRDRLESAQDDPWAEHVRDTYVVHLDSWVRYLEAVQDDPEVLLGDTTRYTIDINRTGAAFVRAVEEAPDGLDDEVARFAEDLVARGFPPPEDSQV
jgi:hypothetical protein